MVFFKTTWQHWSVTSAHYRLGTREQSTYATYTHIQHTMADTTADAAIDWNNLKQTTADDAVIFFHRVAASIAHFFNRTCGSLLGDDTRTARKFALFKDQAEELVALKDEWATSVVDKLVTAQRKDPRLEGTIGAANREPQEATAAYTTYVRDMQELITKTVIQYTTEKVYIALQGRLTRALILKTLHAGLKYQKCKDIVFKAMLEEYIDWSDLSRLLRSTEQAIEANQPNDKL